MNRTLLVQTLAKGPLVARGRISVLTRFEHPTRGSVRCPAAPAFAATLAERLRPGTSTGRDVALDSDFDAGRHTRATVTAAVSYFDRDGHATGLAVALPSDDAAALDAVLRAVCEWTGVIHTRRVLVAEQPSCAASATAAAMCPHRRTAQASVLDFANRGDSIVLIAEPDNALAEQLAQDARGAGGQAAIVHEVADAAALDGVDGDALSFVIVPGTRIEVAAPILHSLRERFPRLRGQHPDEYCYGRSDWYETVRSVAAASECVLVLTEPAEPTDPTVVEVVDTLGVPCIRVTDPADLRPAQLDFRAIGLVPTGSVTADKRVAEAIELLGGLGPLSARRRASRTEPLRPSSAGQGTRSVTSTSQNTTGWWGSGLLP